MTTQRLIANLECDARNELHSIMGMLELIAEGSLSDLQYERLRACKSSADRLLRSIQNVHQLVCAETVIPQRAQVDLRAVVADTAGLMEEVARRKGLTFNAELCPGTPALVTADRRCIDDILVRLIDNAIRFTDQGWIDLIVKGCANFAVTPRIEFVVCDSGPGIPEETITRVMNPFAPDHLEGGLGLPIIHQLVQGMGGELSIGRNDGGGSRVIVSLPFQAPNTCESPELNGADCVPGQSSESGRLLNILVAEDSDHSYYVIESYLQEEGHRLTRAQNGANAVDMFKTGAYDLVLMDVHMPVMDGYDATRAIREWETTDGRARVPIVVLSSDSQQTQRQNGAKAGCSGYITKPASKAAVLNSLKRFAGTVIQD